MMFELNSKNFYLVSEKKKLQIIYRLFNTVSSEAICYFILQKLRKS